MWITLSLFLLASFRLGLRAAPTTYPDDVLDFDPDLLADSNEEPKRTQPPRRPDFCQRLSPFLADVEAVATSPYGLALEWRTTEKSSSDEEIVYKISAGYGETLSFEFDDTLKNPLFIGAGEKEHEVSVENLRANTSHNITISALNHSGHLLAVCVIENVATYELPERLICQDVGIDSINLTWTAPLDGSIRRHNLIDMRVDTREVRDPHHMEPTVAGKTYHFHIDALRSATTYEFMFTIVFGHGHTTEWPKANRTTCRTKEGPPEHCHSIAAERSSNLVTFRWEAPLFNGGSEVLWYTLERSPMNQSDWQTVYQDMNTTYTLELENDDTQLLELRVAAANAIGLSPYTYFNFSLVKEESSRSISWNTITGLLSGILAVSVLTVIVAVAYAFRRKHKYGCNNARSTELEVLRSLQTSNPIYSPGYLPTNHEISSLNRIPRSQISLVRHIGSGAFGDVYEGYRKMGSKEIAVAIKTSSTADEKERQKFLREAVLMLQFTHPHILHCLGVCLDSAIVYIVLELMEGGDLLSYLRNARSSRAGKKANSDPGSFSTTPACRLTLFDGLDICYQMADGCKYLEEVHFVHRDIAARNCLVSTSLYSGGNRTVKIGDFGLARDVYRNDYYRKEGEALLPVRWMAPESLVDGIFTVSCDVWSFGVLMWEVWTLGQQPYPARTNAEVLDYVVREGGRLSQPDCCPEEIFYLMRSCWASRPDQRPSFCRIYSQMSDLKETCDKDVFNRPLGT